MHLRRGRLVAAAGGAAAAEASGGPRLVERHGKLVRAHPDETPSFVPAAAAQSCDPVVAPAPAQSTGKVGMTLIGIFVCSLLLPVSWAAGSLRLTPYTIFLAIGFLPLVGLWLARSRTRMMLPDFLMLAFCCWSSVALGLNGGWAASAEPIGIQWLTTFGAYLAGRMLVRDARAHRAMLIFVTVLVLALLPMLLIEMLTGKKPLIQLASLLGRPVVSLSIGQRFGLERAQGPFEHPIAAGIFLASMLSPAVYVIGGKSLARRILFGGATALAAICSVSTAALLSLNTQFGLMAWSRILRSVRQRWRILTALLVTLYVTIDLLSTKTPFHVFVNYATLSQGSSYNRILIWQYGSAEALRNPFFGIGLGEWARPRWMSSSMDNFWLVEAVRYGIPSLVLLVSAIVMILWRIGARTDLDAPTLMLRRAVIFSIVGTMLTVCSAHLWNASYAWFLFFIGSTGWLALRPPEVAPPRASHGAGPGSASVQPAVTHRRS